MKEVKDLTPADLLAEERRWVIWPGRYVEGCGFLVDMVFENHPQRFTRGITNMTSDLPDMMSYFPASDDSAESREIAHALAQAFCLETLGIHKRAYMAVIASSMKASESCKFVKVLGEHPDNLTLQNGYGEQLHVDEEAAYKLYQDIAAVLDLPCQHNCPLCDEILEDNECCPECG